MIAQEHIPHVIYSPKTGEEAIYSFVNNVTQSNAKRKPKYYTSKVKIRCVDYDATDYYFQILVLESVYQGDRTPKLLRKVNMAFDHIMLTTNKKGLITGVNNLEVLQKNWLKQKENLKKEYEGAAVLKLFKSIDNTLRKERRLIKALQHPKMYGLFFNGCWVYDALSSNTKVKLNVKSEGNITTISVEHIAARSDYKGHFLYKNKKLLESNIILDTIKYNALCLG